jgi:photosystem II stability/assembly factor-like uncharacterized protein
MKIFLTQNCYIKRVMRSFYRLFTIVLLMALFVGLEAQTTSNSTWSEKDLDYASYPYWIEMMNDHSVNFYEVQKAFETYFQNRDKGKGSGWKQFKRWEYFMEPRVFPTGERINSTQLWREMKAFNKLNPPAKNTNDNTWMPLGPATSQNITGHWNPGLGRINVIVRDPVDTSTLYIGAPAGGLWKTVNEGLTWTVLTDDLPILGVSAIAIDYTDTDIIYIGTGDKDASDTYSIGVLKSTDGGANWDETGIAWETGDTRTIAKLLIHPTDPSILFAATTIGLFKTTDGGSNWSNVLAGDIDDIEFKPGDPDVVYAVTKNFYRSFDGGDSFTQISGLPDQDRVQIAVSEANPDYVYFFSSRDGIYRSGDSGLSFSKRSSAPNKGVQDWYDLAFAVSHIDAEEVHLGEINTWRSINGGLSWSQTTEWSWPNNIGYTHCDIHEMVFFGGTLYVGSDGLVSKSTDHGDSWTNLSEGLSIRQFYRIGGTRSNPNKYLGGSQDNGTSVFTEDEWHEWLGADGMECLVDYTDDNIVYGTSQSGTFYKSNTGGYNGGVSIAQPGAGAWVTPFVIHPTEPETLFVGLSEVRKTTNGMQSWSTISNFGAGNINNMVIANSNPDYLYVSKGTKIFRTKDGGQSWDDITSDLPYLHITSIAIHPGDAEKVAVSFSGFESENKVYISTDAGDHWLNYSENLPNIPTNCLAYNDDYFDGLYVGMDVGVYYRDQTLDEWESFMEGLPNVIVNEFEIHAASGKIRAGTFGRGLWETNLHPSVPTDIVMSYTVKSGDDDVVEYDETTYLDMMLTNNMSDTAHNVSMSITTDNPFISLIDSVEVFGNIPAGDSITVVDAFSFDVSSFIPNNHPIKLLTTIVYDSIIKGRINLKGFSPVVGGGNTIVDDGDNGRLDPGDDAVIDLVIENKGGSAASNINVSISTDDEYATIDNTTAFFSELTAGQSDTMRFDISVSEYAPNGHVILLVLNVDADKAYTNVDTVALTVGLIYEDFETGDFSKYPWEFDGNADWTIDEQTVYEGIYSVKSGDIDDSQESVLILNMDVLGNGTISFYKKVSCENDPLGTGYDYLAFLIDDKELGRWDGEEDWSQETFDVEAGQHTFRWRFYKDGYVSEGEDAAWVDYIVLPPIEMPVGVEENATVTKNDRIVVFPNPTAQETTISFVIDEKMDVKLDIFNSSGKKVISLMDQKMIDKGRYSIKWKGNDERGNPVPDGLYIYRLSADKQYAGRIILMH